MGSTMDAPDADSGSVSAPRLPGLTNCGKRASTVCDRSSGPVTVRFARCFAMPQGGPICLRDLDPADTFWQAFHNIGSLMICNCISVLSTHPILLEHVQAAARMLACRHQALRCSIEQRFAEDHVSREPENTGASRQLTQTDKLSRRLWSIFTLRFVRRLSCPCRKRKNGFIWKDQRSLARVDVAMARLQQGEGWDAGANCGMLCEDDWMKAMAYEQSVRFDTEKGPLWRLRLLPSRRLPAETALRCPEGGHSSSRREGSHEVFPPRGPGISASDPSYNYRTHIVGVFHHSVMDGLSRQNFWNELSCFLLVLQNLDRCESYVLDLQATTAAHVNVPSHPQAGRTAPSVAQERALPTGHITADSPSGSVLHSRRSSQDAMTSIDHWGGKSAVSVAVQGCSKTPLPVTRLPEAVTTATPLPIPLEMLKIVLLAPHLLAWGYVWERRSFRLIRNPFPAYYPPAHFRSEAMWHRGLKLAAAAQTCSSRIPLESSVHATGDRAFTSVIPIYLGKDLTDKLIWICRGKKTGLNGLIIAAAAVAMSEMIWNRRELLEELDHLLDQKGEVSIGHLRRAQGDARGVARDTWSEEEDLVGLCSVGVLSGSSATRRPCCQSLAETSAAPASYRTEPAEGCTGPEDPAVFSAPVPPAATTPTESLSSAQGKGATKLTSGFERTSTTSESHTDSCRLKRGSEGCVHHGKNCLLYGESRRGTCDCPLPPAHKIRAALMKGLRRVGYFLEQLSTVFRKPAGEIDPLRLGASRVENHRRPVYLYSLQAISGRRWFKHAEKAFEPTEFEDQAMLHDFLIEEARSSLGHIASLGLQSERPPVVPDTQRRLRRAKSPPQSIHRRVTTMHHSSAPQRGCTSATEALADGSDKGSHCGLSSSEVLSALAADSTGDTTEAQGRVAEPAFAESRSFVLGSPVPTLETGSFSLADPLVRTSGRNPDEATQRESNSYHFSPKRSVRQGVSTELPEANGLEHHLSEKRRTGHQPRRRTVPIAELVPGALIKDGSLSSGCETEGSDRAATTPGPASKPSSVACSSVCSTACFDEVEDGPPSNLLDGSCGVAGTSPTEAKDSFRSSLAASLARARSWIERKSRGKPSRVASKQGVVECLGKPNWAKQLEHIDSTQVLPRPGMGSYALVMPIRLRVSPDCASLGTSLWELANKAAKDVHTIVNAQHAFRPSYALIPWHSVTVYARSVVDNLNLLSKVSRMNPSYRPSAFLISNGGKWDATCMETFMRHLILEVVHTAKKQRSLAVYRQLRQQMCEEGWCDRGTERGPVPSSQSLASSPVGCCSPLGTRYSWGSGRPPEPSVPDRDEPVKSGSSLCHSRRPGSLPGSSPPLQPHVSRTFENIATKKSASFPTGVPKFHPSSLKIESSWSAVAQHNVGLNYFAHNVATVNGALNWTLQYHTNTVSRELAACYARRILSILLSVCELEDQNGETKEGDLCTQGPECSSYPAHGRPHRRPTCTGFSESRNRMTKRRNSTCRGPLSTED
ncbi:hypothetical protein CSUI_001892 [Cystoisospora suis]|uniref:Uncharacterized protein n=1 Tax=Cystoisospora suis TaxID=483139 RepID=A0A2C6LBC8_9APIC|nr:hypothetical protein CSUI_001892 [Cystoisospora suis]